MVTMNRGVLFVGLDWSISRLDEKCVLSATETN